MPPKKSFRDLSMDDPMEDIDDDREAEESEEEEYDENADEDFNPEKADAEAEQSSSEEEEAEETSPKQKGKKGKKRKQDEAKDALAVELDSGDEATIEERKRKKRKKQDDTATPQEEESGGEGGFVRTRAQRLVEKEERKHRKRARDGQVTIDVDEVWKDLSSAPIGRAAATGPPPVAMEVDGEDGEGNKENSNNATTGEDPNELITIKRRIEFAGEITEIEEKHPRGSKEAQKYLAEHPEADPKHPQNDPSGVQKPLKRPSIFEPNPAGNVKGVAPEKLRRHAPTKMEGLMSQRLADMKRNAQKMSTVQKSQLDWKGFVDKEGLRDELNEYGKSKKGFLAREAFLDRAAGAREQAARDARSRL